MAHYNRVACRLQDRGGPGSSEARVAKVIKTERPRSEWIVVPVPRIVDDAIFAKAKQRIAENRRFAARRLKRKHVYLLKGLLRCGMCGHAYSGMTRTASPKWTGFVRHSYYLCTKYGVPHLESGEGRCPNARLLVAGADEAVWSTVRDLLADGDAVAAQLEAWLKGMTADPAEDRERPMQSRLVDL